MKIYNTQKLHLSASRVVANSLFQSDKSSLLTPTCCTDVFQLTYHTPLFPDAINVNKLGVGPAVR